MTESFLAPLLSEKAERRAVSSHALNSCLQLVFCSFNLSLRSHQLHLADRATPTKSRHDSGPHIPQPALVEGTRSPLRCTLLQAGEQTSLAEMFLSHFSPRTCLWPPPEQHAASITLDQSKGLSEQPFLSHGHKQILRESVRAGQAHAMLPCNSANFKLSSFQGTSG